MNTVRLSNIPLKTFREFLFDKGCSRTESGTKGRGGHEKWEKEGVGEGYLKLIRSKKEEPIHENIDNGNE